MAARLLYVLTPLLLCVSWVTLQLPVVHDSYCQAAVKAPFVQGHDILIAEQPEEALQWKLDLLKEANLSIEFSMGFAGGILLQQASDIVREQMENKPNLRVYFFVADTYLMSREDRSRLEQLAQDFPDQFHYLVRWLTFLRQGLGFMTTENHIKMLVVDGKYCVLGGSNFLHYYGQKEAVAERPWLGWADHFHPRFCVDQDVLVKGPIVAGLRHEFYQLWDLYESGESLCDRSQFISDKDTESVIDSNFACSLVEVDQHPNIIADVAMKAIVSGPRRHLGACTAEYAQLVQGAEQSIDLMHMFFSPVNEVYSNLIEAGSRGVELTLVTNAAGEHAPLITKAIGSHNRAFLFPLAAGRTYRIDERQAADTQPLNACSIYDFDCPDCLYHKKVMVVDKRITVMGSYNLGHKSHYGDYEMIVEADDDRVANVMLQLLERDKDKATACETEKLKDWYFGFGSRSISLLEGAFIVGPLY